MMDLAEKEESLGLLSIEDPLAADIDYSLKARNSRQEFFVKVIRFMTTLLLDLPRRIAVASAPSFIVSYCRGQKISTEKLRPTAYLDALRGIAAWAVVNTHLSTILVKHAGAGFGHPGGHWAPYKLPIIKTLFNGSYAVALFFVISGFALSVGPIQACRAPGPRDAGAFAKKLSGTIFRRPFRLWLPAIASTFIVFFLIRMDYFATTQRRMPIYQELVSGWNVADKWPRREDSFWTQVWSILYHDNNLMNLFTDSEQEDQAYYNGVLWTVKLEWRCSLLLYLVHATLFFMPKRTRVSMLIAMIAYCTLSNILYAAHFLAGYLIAEFSQLSWAEPNPNDNPKKGSFRHLRTVYPWFLAGLGLFLGSYPGWDAAGTPGYSWMVPINPLQNQPIDRWWAGIGAVLFVWSIRKLPPVIRFLSAPSLQYLGKISFAMYLVHFPMVQGIGWEVFYFAWSLTGQANVITGTIGFLIGYVILVGLVVWAADIFWRCVDTPSVNAAMRLQKWLFTEA